MLMFISLEITFSFLKADHKSFLQYYMYLNMINLLSKINMYVTRNTYMLSIFQ